MMARKAKSPIGGTVVVGGKRFSMAQLDDAIAESRASRPSIVTSRPDPDVTLVRGSIVTAAAAGRHNSGPAPTRTARAEGLSNRCRECGVEIPRTRRRGVPYGGDGRPRWYCGAGCRKRASRRNRAVRS